MSDLALAARGWRDRRRARWSWLAGIVLYGIMMLSVFPAIEGSDEFADLAESYPEALQALFGGAESFALITTPAGFADTYVFSFMLPLMLMAMAGAAGASLLAGEDEGGQLELVLSLPVERRRVVLEKCLVVAAEVVLVTGAMVLVLLAGGPLVDLDLGVTHLLAAGVGSVLYGWVHGALAFLVGALVGRRSVALGVVVAVAVGGYLVSALAELASWMAPARYLSPLYHANADRPVANGVPLANHLLLVAVVAVLVALAVWAFERHDL